MTNTFFREGGIQKVRLSLRGRRGVFKKRTKTTKGGGGPDLFVRSLYKKITAK